MVLTDASSASDFDCIGAVANDVREVLRVAPLVPSYRSALQVALEAPGCILADAPGAHWTLCVSMCCIAAGGRWQQAVPIAAAVELFMMALELLDDEEDEEESQIRSDLGPARLLNVSTGLLFLAQRGLMAAGGPPATSVLLEWALRASSGQDEDLGAKSMGDIDAAEALAVTERKSGSLVAAACQLGALCAGVDSTVQALYAEFGSWLGMVAQLANDLAAVAPGVEGKTDIDLRRPTLPLVYAASQPPSGRKERDGTSDPVPRLGIAPLALTWVVAESYRGWALDLIPQLTTDASARRDLARLVRVL